MTWTPDARGFLLETDDHFHAWYCEPATLARLFAPNPDAGPHAPRVASLRRIVRRLSELMPNAAHSTPGWNTRPLPVIGMGYMNRGGRIAGARRVGVGQQEGHLYLLVDGRIAEQFPALAIGQAPDWVHWWAFEPANGAGQTLWRYATPIDLHDDGPPPVGHPLHAEHVIGQFLSSTGDATVAPTQELQGHLQPYRMPAEEHLSLQAIYPALFRRWMT